MATFIITTQTHTDTTTHTITITDTDTDTDTNTMSGISYQTEHGAVLKKAEPEALFYSKKAAKKAKNAARKPATKTVFSQADVLGLGGAEAQTGKLPALTTEAAAKALSSLPRHAVRVDSVRIAPTCECVAAKAARAAKGKGKGKGKGKRVPCTCERVTQYSCRGSSRLTRLQFSTPEEALNHLVSREGYVFVTGPDGELIWERFFKEQRKQLEREKGQLYQRRRRQQQQQKQAAAPAPTPVPVGPYGQLTPVLTIPAATPVATAATAAARLVWTEEGEHPGQAQSRRASDASSVASVASAASMASTVSAASVAAPILALQAEAPAWELVRNKTSSCSICTEAKPTSQFSGSQLRKPDADRKCAACIRAQRAPAVAPNAAAVAPVQPNTPKSSRRRTGVRAAGGELKMVRRGHFKYVPAPPAASDTTSTSTTTGAAATAA